MAGSLLQCVKKSDGEMIVIQAAMAAYLESGNRFLSDYLESIFRENEIKGKYDVRHDKTYYNQNNADTAALMAEKKQGERLRTRNYAFFLSMAFAYQDGQATLENIKEILNDIFLRDGLNFDDLETICFVGDGVFFRFPNKVLEIRPSGTDAKSKSYAMGDDKMSLARFAMAIGDYDGTITELHARYIPATYSDPGNDHPQQNAAIRMQAQRYDTYYQEGLPEKKLHTTK
jgi:phosphomannomutase